MYMYFDQTKGSVGQKSTQQRKIRSYSSTRRTKYRHNQIQNPLDNSPNVITRYRRRNW